MTQTSEWTKIWHNPQLDVDLLQAHFTDHAFPRHNHDYYVITLIERGRQSFSHLGTKYYTPPGGLILINPGAAHTGEAVDAQGFQMLSLYPTPAHMQSVVYELTGRHQAIPFFEEVRVDHPWVVDSVRALHKALTQGSSPLECEARFTWTLAELVKRYADVDLTGQRLGQEPAAICRARRFIEEHYAEGINLTQLAAHVSLSPYYLLRVFRSEVGMPPYAYLESVRIRHAQQLIEAGRPLAEVALDVGFSSQSHLTNRFRQIIGVPPGQYARERRP